MPFLARVLAGCALFATAGAGHAWSDHASLLWPMLRTIPELLAPSLRAQSLDAFLAAEAEGLEALLAAEEQRARARSEHYAARPEALRFSSAAPDRRAAFLAAIRVNPTLSYPLYRQDTVEDEPAAALAWSSLSIPAVGAAHPAARYRALAPGEPVAPAHVIASASDEPDFGMDIGLFTDSGTAFGRRYGFGAQPFGNPNLDYGSQAPFHMGFYHLDYLTRSVRPDLLRTYPAWRVSLFDALARFAFARGHEYWGWRFSGWALHYIGDLTQPYHAQPLPGVGTLKALWLVLRGRTAEAIQLVSNRHGLIESYQYQRVQADLRERAWDTPLMTALAASAPLPVWQEHTLVEVLARDSVAAGAELDAALLAHAPARFVADPSFEWTGSGEEPRVLAHIEAQGGTPALDAVLLPQMARFSRFSRAWVQRTLTLAASQSALIESNNKEQP